MAAVVVASNILVQFLFGQLAHLGRLHLPARLSGHRRDEPRLRPAGRRARWCSRASSWASLCSLIGSQIMLQGDGYTYAAGEPARRGRLGHRLPDRAAARCRHFQRACARRSWWLPPLASTLVGSAVDTALFFSIAFAASITLFGPEAERRSAGPGRRCPSSGVGAVVPLWVSLGFRRLARQTFARFGGTCAVSGCLSRGFHQMQRDFC